ncbi:hypothetical protein L6164_019378 [Bauhinia variegata]|uniref:Uncharacterized protein n=1 Tax=Bauhinia variegata TaxID=167791 RepID=A0ACB9MV21_BAUVA|nr:hypothetical protein L6164_019378 [Bauhinia variegata]
MEQFRHIGEILGSLKALMVLRDEIQINQRQCCLILDIFSLAFETISDEIRQNLQLEERNSKWKALENPLRELCRVFREGEFYIKQCLDSKDWWGKAITLSQNKDCVEFHIHNLLCHFPAVIAAIENAGVISGTDEDEKEKKKVMLTKKYDMEWIDPKLFQWRFGKQYLIPREICKQLENAWTEDRWRLIEALKKKKTSTKVSLTKNEQLLADLLLKKLRNSSEKVNKKIFPSAILLGAKDYQVRRRVGRGSEFKEIQWNGQNLALKHFHGELEAFEAEITTLLSLSHPNILQYLSGFYDEEKKEVFLVTELVNKDLWSYMKENYGPRRQILFAVPVIVDLMLQIARGMEYLHSKNIYHGYFNPYNILLKARNSQEGYFQAKIVGYGLSSVKNDITRSLSTSHEDVKPHIWYAPEVLSELQEKGIASKSRYSEKADVYSFGMICFELMTGKVPFEDGYLQGERTNRSIAGERPLFPYPSPKYLVSLIKKCWQTDPKNRPTFSSICRILRYTKKFLAMNTEYFVINPELNLLELQSPPVDYCDIEAVFLKNFPVHRESNLSSVSQIPYEMFAYKVAERGKSSSSIKDKSSESPKAAAPRHENGNHNKDCEDRNASNVEDPHPETDTNSFSSSDTQSLRAEAPTKKTVTIKEGTEVKFTNDQALAKLRTVKSLPLLTSDRSLKINKAGNQLPLDSKPSSSNQGGRKSIHVLDSDRNLRISKRTQLASASSHSTQVRRKRSGHASDSKSNLTMKKGNESPATLISSASNTNRSLKMKRGIQSPKTTRSLSTGRLRGYRTDTSLKIIRGNMSPYGLSPMTACARKRCDHASDSDSSLKMTGCRRRSSPLALSPLSPYTARTCGHVSDSESSSQMKRGSLSPLGLSPLSPYVTRTSGHVSD